MRQFWEQDPGEARQGMSPPWRFDQLNDWLFTRGVTDPDQMSNLPLNMREQLRSSGILQISKPLQEYTSKDGSIKTLFQGQNGLFEAVWMPFSSHATLCVSSQSGCSMGCTFCATATMERSVNLSTGEILGQYLWARGRGLAVDRIVFMGMGEPFSNYERVVRSLHWLTGIPSGMSPRRITVSTVGLLPQMERYWQEEQTDLAVSVNGWDNASRASWMPAGSRWNFDRLVDWMRGHAGHSRRRITCEYIVTGDRMSDDAVRGLAKAFGRSKVRINLIPWNAWDRDDLTAPDDDRLSEFGAALAAKGCTITVRRSRALDVSGACGQLVRTEECA